MSTTQSTIILVPIGNIEERILNALAKELEKKFACTVTIHAPMEVPQEAYNSSRNQFHSSRILSQTRLALQPQVREKVLAVTDVDLYVERLNFVFGEAELGGSFAIISLARLHQTFYGLPEENSIFLERTIKEAVHELGHVFGLGHCPDPGCVMYFSNRLLDTDRKNSSFCARCKEPLRRIEGR